ncbi:hypothetical protein Dsin_024005 [Dipteronia sinensis]|uniref:Cytochrome P450 n=1 Tax=Dipteronia sinensis TaxID=43782 RepID=A0AAE0E171_9ROSI|nr:hypothetical protein Dsin_024005 [Dipteronia sinensis]
MLLRWVSGIRSQLQKLHHVTDRILENIIKEHNNQGKTTTSDVGKSNDEENHEDLVDVLLKDIFSAGIETSATTIDWVMSELMKNPRLMKKAQIEVRRVFNQKGKLDEMGINEMKYLKAVIKETLRLHPAAPLLSPRECRESCKIKEFDIPIKTKVLVNAWAIGRDPKHWSEPERFVPERFIDSPLDYNGTHFEYLPFGAGRRMCPGMSFGLANIEIALAMLLYHFDWKLPNEMKQEEDLNMTEVFGITVKRKDDLCLIPIPYHLSM